MRKKGGIKYFLVICICLFIFIYGFIIININKPELVRKKSNFIIDLRLKPVDFRIETKGYEFYVNGKIFDDMKEKYNDIYNGIFSK